jgi:hypothetical protein
VEHVQAPEGLELVVVLEIRRGIAPEGRVHQHLDALPLQDLRHPGVRLRIGEVDAVEAHAPLEPVRAAHVEPDDAQTRSALEQALRQARAEEAAQSGDRDRAREFQRVSDREEARHASRLAAPSSLT